MYSHLFKNILKNHQKKSKYNVAGIFQNFCKRTNTCYCFKNVALGMTLNSKRNSLKLSHKRFDASFLNTQYYHKSVININDISFEKDNYYSKFLHYQNFNLELQKSIQSISIYEKTFAPIHDYVGLIQPNKKYEAALENFCSEDWKTLSTSDLIHEFIIFSQKFQKYWRDICDKQLNRIIYKIADNLCDVSNDELFALMEALCLWPEINMIDTTPVYSVLRKSIDEQMNKRSKDLCLDEIFKLFNLVFLLQWSTVSDFNKTKLYELAKVIDEIPKQYFVLCMFYIKVCKYWPRNLNMKIVIKYITQNFNTFSVEELAIISVALQRKIPSNAPLIYDLFKIFLSNSDSMKNEIFSSYLKLMKRCDLNKEKTLLLFEAMRPQIERRDVMSLLDIVEFGSKNFLYDPVIVSEIGKKIQNDLINTRYKDFYRFVKILLMMESIPLNCNRVLRNMPNLIQKHLSNFYPDTFSITNITGCAASLIKIGIFNNSLISSTIKLALNETNDCKYCNWL